MQPFLTAFNLYSGQQLYHCLILPFQSPYLSLQIDCNPNSRHFGIKKRYAYSSDLKN